MAGSKDKTLLKNLQKQVRLLQKKEQQTRNKLKLTLKKMRTQGQSFKSKFTKNVRDAKNKVAGTKAAIYAKLVKDLEGQVQKRIVAKKRLMAAAITRFEKKFMAKLTKGLTKKSKKLVASKSSRSKK